MPRATTLADVVPVLWDDLRMGESERIRTLTRAGFDRVMDKREMALTKRVRDRVWSALVSNGLAVASSCTYGAVDIDTSKMRAYLIDNGLADSVSDLGTYSPDDAYTHTYDAHTRCTHTMHTHGEGAQ